MTEEVIYNGQIEKVRLGFEDIPPGMNFVLKIYYDSTWGSGVMTFNPLVIPKLLKILGFFDLNSLEGAYVKLKGKDTETCAKAIQGILSKDANDWVVTDERYFGEDYMIGECINWWVNNV